MLDGKAHEVAYEQGERVLHAARRADRTALLLRGGLLLLLHAKLVKGKVEMAANDCLTPSCWARAGAHLQARCTSKEGGSNIRMMRTTA